MNEFEFILYVKNQEQSKLFYEIVLDIKPCLDVAGMTEFQLAENCKLGLMPEDGIARILQDKTPHPSLGNNIPRCEIYLKLNNIESYLERAINAGAKLISEIQERSWGDTVGYVSDLDGHIIAFAEKRNQNE